MEPRPQLDGVIAGHLQRFGIPGCSVAVVDRAGVLWSKGYGYSDIGTESRADASTVYHLFSGTKLYTAAAILLLVEGGELDLEADVTEYLGDMPQLRGIKLLHLLSHTSGLKDTAGGFLSVHFPGDEHPTTAEALAAFQLRRQAEPGGEARYRNVNYAVLGEVISRVSGATYREFVCQSVLEPLGSTARFEISELGDAVLATGYIGRWDPTRVLLRIVTPGAYARLHGMRKGSLYEVNPFSLSTASIGGLVGSVGSFAPFLQSQLGEGAPLLSVESTSHMQSLVAKGQIGHESKVGVGLGWKHGSANGHAYLNHEGGGAGFTTETRLYPQAGLGVVLAMNLSSLSKTMHAAHLICEAIHDAHAAP